MKCSLASIKNIDEINNVLAELKSQNRRNKCKKGTVKKGPKSKLNFLKFYQPCQIKIQNISKTLENSMFPKKLRVDLKCIKLNPKIKVEAHVARFMRKGECFIRLWKLKPRTVGMCIRDVVYGGWRDVKVSLSL